MAACLKPNDGAEHASGSDVLPDLVAEGEGAGGLVALQPRLPSAVRQPEGYEQAGGEDLKETSSFGSLEVILAAKATSRAKEGATEPWSAGLGGKPNAVWLTAASKRERRRMRIGAPHWRQTSDQPSHARRRCS